jgi:hypothetical protein
VASLERVLFSGPYAANRKSYIRYNIFDVSMLKKHASVAALTLVQPAFQQIVWSLS